MKLTNWTTVVVALVASVEMVTSMPFDQKPFMKDPILVQVFGMSKCPDFVYTVSVFSQVLPKVNNIAEFRFEYIGAKNSSAPTGIECKHGSTECDGNIIELCYQNSYNQSKTMQFVRCLNSDYRNIGIDSKLPQHCALELDTDYAPVASCIKEKGVELLKKSVRQTNALGVTKSATIYIDGQKRCIRDDGSWKDCRGGHEVIDFINDIKKAYSIPR